MNDLCRQPHGCHVITESGCDTVTSHWKAGSDLSGNQQSGAKSHKAVLLTHEATGCFPNNEHYCSSNAGRIASTAPKPRKLDGIAGLCWLQQVLLHTQEKKMAKLTDIRLIVLSKAAQREDGAAMVPVAMKKAAAAKVGSSLMTRRLLCEVRAKPGMPVWRTDENDHPRSEAGGLIRW